MNERELRQRRADLQALVDVGARLDDVSDPLRQARVVLDGLAERFGFDRGVVIGAVEDHTVVLAARGTTVDVTSPSMPDAIVRKAWDRRELLPVKRLDAATNPLLAMVMPGAVNLLVSPMVADGRPVGAIVVEHRSRRIFGVERRVASVLGQFAAVAALNLRNAVLLRHVQDLAERDALTGAANRRTFQETLERVLASSAERGPSDPITAVLFIDLDDFKVINDTLGHAAGDDLLVAVTERISGLVRQTDLVARLGGDEFAVLCENASEAQAGELAERIRDAIEQPFQIEGARTRVGISIGVARTDADGGDAALEWADRALYQAKADGGGAVRWRGDDR
jgi:diguanylate cyclase (GGDEF)-like protein